MNERATVFFCARDRNSPRASLSDFAADKFRGSSSRMFFGTVASISSSRFSKSSVSSISARAWRFGPMCRCANESTRSVSRVGREAAIGDEATLDDAAQYIGIDVATAEKKYDTFPGEFGQLPRKTRGQWRGGRAFDDTFLQLNDPQNRNCDLFFGNHNDAID